MKAIIHIGLPKTGSTTIQAFLHRNRRTLARRGVAYRRYPAGWPNQTELAVAALASVGQQIPEERFRLAARLTAPKALRSFVRHYEDWFDAQPAQDTMLLCCEVLSTWLSNADQVAALHRWLCERFSAVSYILYLRQPEDWIVSEYSQRIRNGASLPLEDFLAEMPLPDFADLRQRWQSVVGGPALDIRLLDRAALVNGDLLDDYCAATGIEPKGLVRVAENNRQLSSPAATAIRKVNAATHRLVAHDLSRRALRKVLRLVIETVAPRTPPLGLTTAQRETLRSNTEANYRTFAQAAPRNRQLAVNDATALQHTQDTSKGTHPWPF